MIAGREDLRGTVRQTAAALGPLELVTRLGLADGARRAPSGAVTIRCPWHTERTPSCEVRRHPSDGMISAHCFGCDAGGDVFHLYAAARGLDTARDFAAMLDELAALLGCDPARPRPILPARPAPPPNPPPAQAEVLAFWEACRSVAATAVDPSLSDLRAAFYIARRRWHPGTLAAHELARLAPAQSWKGWPAWWPRGRAERWPLIVPMFDGGGDLTSIHGLAVDFGAEREALEAAARAANRPYLKTIAPRGAGRGYFADAAARRALAGDVADLDGVLVAEGCSDFIAAALDVHDTAAPLAVVGATSGNFPGLGRALATLPPGLRFIIAADSDAAGERYAGEIRAALPTGADVRRWRPMEHRA